MAPILLPSTRGGSILLHHTYTPWTRSDTHHELSRGRPTRRARTTPRIRIPPHAAQVPYKQHQPSGSSLYEATNTYRAFIPTTIVYSPYSRPRSEFPTSLSKCGRSTYIRFRSALSSSSNTTNISQTGPTEITARPPLVLIVTVAVFTSEPTTCRKDR
jgi:hypothetical protein